MTLEGHRRQTGALPLDRDANRALCYNPAMTRDQAKMLTERFASLPREAQEELLRDMQRIESKHQGPQEVSDEEWEAIQEGIAQSDRGEYVPDEEMATFFKQHGL